MIDKNDALLTAVHAHEACDAVTVTLSLVAPAPWFLLVGFSVNVHPGVAPACVTENVCPAIVSVPERDAVSVLASTE